MPPQGLIPSRPYDPSVKDALTRLSYSLLLTLLYNQHCAMAFNQTDDGHGVCWPNVQFDKWIHTTCIYIVNISMHCTTDKVHNVLKR